MTPKQQKTLAFVVRYIGEIGMSPTYREIADHLAISSLGAAAKNVIALEGEGYLRRKGGKNRVIELSKKGEALAEVWRAKRGSKK